MSDPNGLKITQEMIKDIQIDGTSTIAYVWPKPGTSGNSPKIGHAVGVEDWDWVVGTGTYVDTIDTKFWEIAVSFAVIALAMLGAVVAASLWISRSITRPLSSPYRPEQRTRRIGPCASGVPGRRRRTGSFAV
jgi:methyl-accepting chemotaxis protein